MTVYMFMGLAGLPVFSNMTGGYEMIFKPTFGYIIGFIFCAYATGKIIELFKSRGSKLGYFIGPVVGILVDYLIGVPYLMVALGHIKGHSISLQTGLVVGFYPYIAFDIIKAALVVFVALSVVPKLEKSNLYN